MKVSSCYNCGSNERTFYAEENGFSLVKCNECGLLYIDERPDDSEISQAHRQGKHRGLEELNVTGKFYPQKIREYVNVLEDIFQGDINGIKTWLDVGCGHGEFMIAVQDYAHGKIVLSGTEPNIYKQESARQRGLNVDFIDLELHKEKYDVISLLNVYSHLPDPPAFIDLLKNCLNPGGSLIIQTGDAADFLAEEQYRPFYLPDHLSFASEKIVVGILQRLGFEIVKVKKYPFLRLNPKQIAKEVVKAILPQYRHLSKIRYYFNWGRYAQTDMYIWARLKH